MKHTKILSVLLALLLVMAVAAGCDKQSSASPSESVSAPESAGPADAAVKLTDMAGREVALDKPAERIVVLDAADCEILCAIGAQSTIVGRGEYCDYPEDISAVTPVQSGSETNVEEIISLQPDLLVMTKMAQTVETLTALENAGIQVLEIDAQTIDDIYTAIGLLGRATGKNDEAAAVADKMKTTFSDLAAKCAQPTGKTVYFEVSPLQYGLWAAGTGTFMDELATMLGLTNAFADVSGWGEVSAEQVLSRDPDYIVTTSMSYGDGPSPVEEILSRDGWQDLKAVKNKEVFNADSNAITRPGPRLADAAVALYDFIYSGQSQQAAA